MYALRLVRCCCPYSLHVDNLQWVSILCVDEFVRVFESMQTVSVMNGCNHHVDVDKEVDDNSDAWNITQQNTDLSSSSLTDHPIAALSSSSSSSNQQGDVLRHQQCQDQMKY